MDRRATLRRVGLGASVLLAGCLDQATLIPGQNETLEITNHADEPVTLELTIERGGPPDDREVVFDDTVTVDATSTHTLDVLGDAQFYLTVSTNGATHRFGTRPICDRAYTIIVVTDSKELDSTVEDCE